MRLNSFSSVHSSKLPTLRCSLCGSEQPNEVTELLKERIIQLKMAANTFLGDYLPPKSCWSLKAGAQFQHSLLQLVPKSGVSSAWTPHSVHPVMVTENDSQVPHSRERHHTASSTWCASKKR